MPTLGADDLARGFVAVGIENFILPVVLADHVEHVGEAVRVVVAGVGPEESPG